MELADRSSSGRDARAWARLGDRVVRGVHSWLIDARAAEEEDRRRELTLNWVLLTSIVLALFEAGQRVPPVLAGGTGVSDHGPTLVLACLAALVFCGLLALSRAGRQFMAAGGLLIAYYATAVWLFVAEGTEEPVAIVICAVLIVTAGALLGTRTAVWAVLLITGTLVVVSALDSAGALHPGGPVPGVLEQLAIGGGLGILTLVLSARTGEPHGPAQALIAGSNGSAARLPDELVAKLTVRELQVVRLIAAGQANDDIARQLFISPRTVHTHVSNALRKTDCANRTELAVLAVQRPLGS